MKRINIMISACAIVLLVLVGVIVYRRYKNRYDGYANPHGERQYIFLNNAYSSPQMPPDFDVDHSSLLSSARDFCYDKCGSTSNKNCIETCLDTYNARYPALKLCTSDKDCGNGYCYKTNTCNQEVGYCIAPNTVPGGYAGPVSREYFPVTPKSCPPGYYFNDPLMKCSPMWESKNAMREAPPLNFEIALPGSTSFFYGTGFCDPADKTFLSVK
ncbi:MAG TPA: hypothetical protein VLE02_02060 [Nitrosarchaeum sp.]|nr:hypothetical protein [Nitrosarchaeum sp.]